MADRREDKDEQRRREAEDALKRVERDSETFGTSTFARVARQTKDHFSATDGDHDDPIERWGTIIGRSAGLVFAIALVIYLIVTYVLPK